MQRHQHFYHFDLVRKNARAIRVSLFLSNMLDRTFAICIPFFIEMVKLFVSVARTPADEILSATIKIRNSSTINNV